MRTDGNKKHFNILIPEPKITSNSVQAILYRNMNRALVDELFSKRDMKVIVNGSEQYKFPKQERIKLDRQARNLWRSIIIESNKL